MADGPNFFSNERFQKSSQYREIKQQIENNLHNIRQLLNAPGYPFNPLPYPAVLICEKMNFSGKNLYGKWLKIELDEWKKYRETEVINALKSVIPSENYTVVNCESDGNVIIIVTPEQGRMEAEKLGREIVARIYELLAAMIQEYETIPTGGIVGNFQKWIGIKGQMECGDWSDRLVLGINGKFVSFSIEEANAVWNDNIDNWVNIKYIQHNWVQIVGPGHHIITIDPWWSGGRNIIENDSFFDITGITVKNKVVTEYGDLLNQYQHKLRYGIFSFLWDMFFAKDKE